MSLAHILFMAVSVVMLVIGAVVSMALLTVGEDRANQGRLLAALGYRFGAGYLIANIFAAQIMAWTLSGF